MSFKNVTNAALADSDGQHTNDVPVYKTGPLVGDNEATGQQFGVDEEVGQLQLHRDLRGRHMQMIAM